MTPAEAAISKFIAERRKMRGIHPDDVTGLHAGDDAREVVLRISDMETLLSELDALRARVEVSEAASEAAVSKAQWQAVTNAELNELTATNCALRARLKVAEALLAEAHKQPRLAGYVPGLAEGLWNRIDAYLNK